MVHVYCYLNGIVKTWSNWKDMGQNVSIKKSDPPFRELFSYRHLNDAPTLYIFSPYPFSPFFLALSHTKKNWTMEASKQDSSKERASPIYKHYCACLTLLMIIENFGCIQHLQSLKLVPKLSHCANKTTSFFPFVHDKGQNFPSQTHQNHHQLWTMFWYYKIQLLSMIAIIISTSPHSHRLLTKPCNSHSRLRHKLYRIPRPNHHIPKNNMAEWVCSSCMTLHFFQILLKGCIKGLHYFLTGKMFAVPPDAGFTKISKSNYILSGTTTISGTNMRFIFATFCARFPQVVTSKGTCWRDLK